MMNTRVPAAIFAIIFCTQLSNGQNAPAEKGLAAINRAVIRGQLEFLASDWMEGRRSGERGEQISADYIASMLRVFGVKPAGDLSTATLSDGGRSYFQNFNLIRTTAGNEQSMQLVETAEGSVRRISFTYNADFTLRPASSASLEAPIVFAGYGFKNDKLGFNDFSGLDVKGKFILRLAGSPAFATDKLTPAEIIESKRETEKIARERGAVGIIDINPAIFSVSSFQENMSPAEGTPRPYQDSPRYSLSGNESGYTILRITVTNNTAGMILSGSGNSVEEYRKQADSNQPYSLKPIDNKSIIINTSVNTKLVPVRNILGVIEGTKSDEIIVIGAHYDHMGMNEGYIWNGADDNGSGTVGVMTIAKAIMETGKKPEKTIIIALWTAEEQGLLGSSYYVKNLRQPVDQIRLNVNFDMISRYISDSRQNSVVMTYSSSEKGFREMTAANIKKYGIGLEVDYQPSDNPPGGSDHRSFVEAGIPVMRFKPGHREEYHTPNDEISTIDWDIMEKIIKISFANIWQLADSNW